MNSSSASPPRISSTHKLIVSESTSSSPHTSSTHKPTVESTSHQPISAAAAAAAAGTVMLSPAVVSASAAAAASAATAVESGRGTDVVRGTSRKNRRQERNEITNYGEEE